MIVFIFWLSISLLLSNYFLYPLTIYIISLFSKKTHDALSYQPTVTFVIAAYNESKIIEKKIQNSLELNYPENKSQIIVVSDGSTDDTAAKVLKYRNRGILSLYQPERKGKTAALNRAMKFVRNEIVVFSDANNFFDPEALRYLCFHFHEKSIGGVCGVKKIRAAKKRASTIGDSLFWKYESFIKSKESTIGSIVGADGEIFAIRKNLFTPVDESIINDDAAITIEIIKKGFRVIYETRALSTEYASITLRDDYNVKVRMVAGGYQTILRYRKFLFNFFKKFPLQFFFHKILRWVVPQLMIVILISNLLLMTVPTYKIFLLMQMSFYTTAMAGFLLYKNNIEIKLFYVPFYFCFMNLAAFMGFIAFFRLSKVGHTALWKKAQR